MFRTPRRIAGLSKPKSPPPATPKKETVNITINTSDLNMASSEYRRVAETMKAMKDAFRGGTIAVGGLSNTLRAAHAAMERNAEAVVPRNFHGFDIITDPNIPPGEVYVVNEPVHARFSSTTFSKEQTDRFTDIVFGKKPPDDKV